MNSINQNPSPWSQKPVVSGSIAATDNRLGEKILLVVLLGTQHPQAVTSLENDSSFIWPVQEGPGSGCSVNRNGCSTGRCWVGRMAPEDKVALEKVTLPRKTTTLSLCSGRAATGRCWELLEHALVCMVEDKAFLGTEIQTSLSTLQHSCPSAAVCTGGRAEYSFQPTSTHQGYWNNCCSSNWKSWPFNQLWGSEVNSQQHFLLSEHFFPSRAIKAGVRHPEEAVHIEGVV